jgi:predicted dithiol-disulfide oxidoreductase (DUF899 family)
MENIGTREQWLAARAELLVREKDLTRRSDELARERAALPWVPVEEEYLFCSVDGQVGLSALFGDCSQLLVYHLMMGPDRTEACRGCTYTADTFDRAVDHLAQRDVAFVAVSRAPVPAIEASKARMGWSFRWVSCGASTFNEDSERFGAPECDELHGLSAFALHDGVVHHTYSTFDRGTDCLNTVWQLLDRAPRGRTDAPGWPRRRYEYAAA